jgi:trk system potassium uptake protein TrkA
MKIMIIGGGVTALTLANLLGEDHQITIIEGDKDTAEDISTKTHALVVQGDGSDITLLRESGLEDVDALVATSDDKNNLMICQIAKSESVKKIISLVSDPKNEELFTKLGIHHIVSSVGTRVTAIKRMLYQVGDARIIAQLGQGEVQIVELTISEESKLAGKKATIKNASIAAIYRGGELIIPKPTTPLEAGDLLVVVAKTKDLPEITKQFNGK